MAWNHQISEKCYCWDISLGVADHQKLNTNKLWSSTLQYSVSRTSKTRWWKTPSPLNYSPLTLIASNSQNQSRSWLLKGLWLDWHLWTQTGTTDLLTALQAAGGNRRLAFVTSADWKEQTGHQCMCKCTWKRVEDFLKAFALLPPDTSMVCTSPSNHTLLSLQNEHIVLCRGGQFAEFHFAPSICLMNNNDFEGFTGFQH